MNRARRALSAILLPALISVAAAGCSRSSQESAQPAATAGKVGYVRMQELLQVHPLYPQLAQTERSIDALSLRSLGPQVAQTGSDLSKQDAELEKELKDASERTNQLLKQKQAEYAKQENAAIAAALSAGGRAVGGPPIGAGVNVTAQQQVAQVNAAMGKDFSAYQQTLAKQDAAQSQAFARSVSDRADREYRAKATELQQAESNFALELAGKDAADRLQLRMQLANLAMDEAARDDVRKKLTALDRSESDQVAAMKNRDQQTLVQLHAQLADSARTEIANGVTKIHADNQAKINARAGVAQQTMSKTVTVNVPKQVTQTQSIPPDIKAKIDSLHKEYQDRFNKDAKATIDQFNKTRDELKKRYDALHGIDVASQESARKEIEALQAQHDKLYGQIVDQINREVRLVAESKGISTVLSDIAGSGDSIDLTQAAKKEIESLHE